MGLRIGIIIALSLCSSLWRTAAGLDCAKKIEWACLYNPRPAAEDFRLPMPGDLEMVFVKVVVPGAEFWGNPQRLVKVGDIQGNLSTVDAIFEGLQRLPVFGSFQDAQNENWYYYLGKYEVTVAQYIMLMGDGDRDQGLAIFYRNSGDEKLNDDIREALRSSNDTRLLRALARPLAWLSWYDYQAFIRRYNEWCYDDPTCFQRLPRLPERLQPGSAPSPMPGFFRLPTELEWEYAARGGLAALNEIAPDGRKAFELDLPFERTKIHDYATVKKKNPDRIGRWKATYGFYDLFGNVRELTADLFRAETIQGKVGALTARGASYIDGIGVVRVSQRKEGRLYQLKDDKMVEARSATTGMRLTIGSLVIPSERYQDDLNDEYTRYMDSVRPMTAAGQSSADPVVRATNVDLRAALEVLGAMAQSNPRLGNQIGTVKRSIQLASKLIEEGTADVSDKLVRNAAVILKTAGWHYFRAINRQELMEKIKTMDISGRTAQIQQSQRIYEEHMDGYSKNFTIYVETIEKLKGYPFEYVQDAIETVKQENRDDKPYREVSELIREHVGGAGSDVPKWRQDLESMAMRPGVYVR